MGVIKRIKGIFGRKQGPYEEALRQKLEAVRASVPEAAPTIELVKAAAALVRPDPEEGNDESAALGGEPDAGGEGEAKEEPAKGKLDASSRLLEDLHLGDVEMMEFELLLEDLFDVRFSRSEINAPETLGELAELIDGKKK